MIILIDQDGPLADFEAGFLTAWRHKYPDEFYVPLDQRKQFKICDDYPAELQEKVEEIYHTPGFYLDLPPITGCVDAVNILVGLGHDVRICTSPLSRYENCVLEKYQWVQRYLGREMTKKIILTKDKTLVKGGYLIDDKPYIGGNSLAEWEHILFDCSYNKHAVGKRRITWDNYREMLRACY